jgi:hypothetical protein
MTMSVREATVKTVEEALKDNLAALSSTTKRIAEYEKAAIETMKKRVEAFEGQKRRFFAFDSVRITLFWIGCITNAGTLLLLIYFLFFRG